MLLSMYFGLNQRYDIQARIVYAKQGESGFHARYGMRFVWISDDERFRLNSFVTERMSASQFGVRTFPASPHQGNIS